MKQAVKLECQSFDGTLDVICIKGVFITQLEAAEMAQIMADAQSDCAKSGISVRSPSQKCRTMTSSKATTFCKTAGFHNSRKTACKRWDTRMKRQCKATATRQLPLKFRHCPRRLMWACRICELR